jgi:hypothetical protein
LDILGLQEAKRQQAIKRLAASAPTITAPIRDSFHTAPGYRELSVEYSCIPDPLYPWDPAVLKAIWTFDPRVVPLWVRDVYLSPADTGEPEVVVFGRHGIGITIDNPSTQPTPMPCTMPSMPCQGVSFKAPSTVILVWHSGLFGYTQQHVDLPGEYMPFDMGLYHYLRASYLDNATSKDVIYDVVEGQRLRHEKLKQRINEELEYRMKDVGQYADKQLEKVSEQDWAEHLLADKPQNTKSRVYLGQ